MRFRLRALLASVVLVFASRTAEAALTSSEKAQIRDFVTAARVDNAERVRALVARTDLSADESADALKEGVAAQPFTEPRAAFLRELVFGPASGPSRSLLAQATARALLARANAVLQKSSADLERQPGAVAELASIYGFLDAELAAKPREGGVEIAAAAFEDASRVLREHIDQNGRWLKGAGIIPELVARARAQAQVALLDLALAATNAGGTSSEARIRASVARRDVADRLGLPPFRRKMLVETGVLVVDAGSLDEPSVERLRHLCAASPNALGDLAVLYGADDRVVPRARGRVVATLGPARVDDESPLGEGPGRPRFDRSYSAAVHELAIAMARAAVAAHPELGAQVARDAGLARGAADKMLGRPRAPSVDHVLGAAIHTVLMDAPTALAVAGERTQAGAEASGALLGDAVTALAALAPQGAKGATSIDVGKTGGSTSISGVKFGVGGAVSFSLDGHVYAIERAGGAVSVRRDGQPFGAPAPGGPGKAH